MMYGLPGFDAVASPSKRLCAITADGDGLRPGTPDGRAASGSPSGEGEDAFGGGASVPSPRPAPMASPGSSPTATPRPMVETELPPVRARTTTGSTGRGGRAATADELDPSRHEQIKSATGKVKGSVLVTDFATPAGIGVALLFLIAAIVIGGAPLAFLNLSAALIVVGGVVAVTIASFSWQDLKALWPVIRRTVHYHHRTAQAAALHVLELADYARHNGVLKLQGIAHDSTYNEPLLHEGLQHIIDAMPHDHVEDAMRTASAARAYRHGQAISVLRRAAEVAPAMGLIGTLVGLVQMLSNLQDPSGIGPGMAVALLTTLYGACMGYLALGPLAAKLERLSAAEDLLDEIYIQAVGSIGRKENPRRLELNLNSILPPPERVHFYD